MAPKKEKGPKQLLNISQLTVFLSTYKGACKHYVIVPDKPLLEEVEQKLQICKPLEKILLRGPQHGSSSLCALLDAMAGYPAIRNLACWGCNIGDQGLRALSQLMRASAHKTWTGSKPRSIEIMNDGAQLSSDRWPERYLEQTNGAGDMVTRGSGFQLPSLALGHTQAVTLDTARLQQDTPEAPLDLASLERQLSHLLAATSTSTTSITYQQLHSARAAATAGAAGSGGVGSTGGIGGGGSESHFHPGDGRPLLRPTPPMAFSPEVLQGFSLALATQTQMLQVLVLDHCQLGDLGAKILAPGLRRCGPLQQLSLAHCGIGPDGAAALAASFPPDPNPLLAAVQPKYRLLNLSHNPLCAPGLTALAGTLVHLPQLKALLLAGIEVGGCPADLQALQALADALAANTAVTQLDIAHNEIGDEGAAVLLPFLQSQQHMRKFRVTPRLSRGVLRAVTEAVRANLPKKKKKVLKKKKKAPGL